jgi:hypothetical protein
MKVVSNIIQNEIINKMKLTLKVSLIDGMVISTTCTMWLRVGSVVKDDNDTEFTVTSFIFNESITVNATGFVGNIHLKKPLFFHGTAIRTSIEYQLKDNRSSKKLPIIWLQDGSIVDSKSGRETIGANISGNIFFLDGFNSILLNKDIVSNSVEPMNQLAEHFKNTVEQNFNFFNKLDSFVKTERTRFGKENDQGVVTRYFADDLSGVEARFNFDTYADSQCCALIDTFTPPTCADGTLNILNSSDGLIKSVEVASGSVDETYINDTAIFARNSNADIVATAVSLGGAVSADVDIPDTTYDIYLDGVFKETVTLPTLANEDLNIILV